jgi:hypothetical protein
MHFWARRACSWVCRWNCHTHSIPWGWARPKDGTLIRLKCIYNFWCSMLVYTPFALCFVTLRGVFMHFSGTNLLTKCHSATSLFFAIFLFQKSYTGNIFGIGWNKSRTSYFYRSFAKTEDETKGARGQPHHQGARPSPWPCPPVVRPPGPTTDAAPSPISSPRREKPKGRISFSRNILQAAAVTIARSGGSRSSSRHPVGGLLRHHGRLRSDVWVVYLGLWVHSSS